MYSFCNSFMHHEMQFKVSEPQFLSKHYTLLKQSDNINYSNRTINCVLSNSWFAGKKCNTIDNYSGLALPNKLIFDLVNLEGLP